MQMQPEVDDQPMPAQDMAALADEYWALRAQRLDLDKQSKAVKVSEDLAEATLLKQMRLQGLTAIGGQTVRLNMPVTPEMVPTVADWDVVYKSILESGDFSLLEKRIGKLAVKERWEAGVEVPGVVAFPVWKLSKSGVTK